MKDFIDRVMVITGSASGIGRACALTFAGEGADVVLADINTAGMEETAGRVRSLGRKALCVNTDVTRADEFQRLYERTMEEMGRVDLLMNNAGCHTVGSLHLLPAEEIDFGMRINLLSAFYGVRTFLPQMLRQGHGHIVNTSSGGGIVAFPHEGLYCSAKFGVVGLSEALFYEVKSRGIDVTLVCPGPVKTNFMRESRVGGQKADLTENRTIRFIWSLFGVTPETVARNVVRAVRRRRLYCIPTYPIRLGLRFKRFFPHTINYLARRVLTPLTDPATTSSNETSP